MKKYLFLLLILVVLAACSSNKTNYQNTETPLNQIDLDKALEQSRADNQQAIDKLNKNLETYRTNLNSGLEELEALRKEFEELLNDPDFINPDTEQLKHYVSDKDKDAAQRLNKIEYKDKLELIKNRIKEIEKYLREDCKDYIK